MIAERLVEIEQYADFEMLFYIQFYLSSKRQSEFYI